MNTAAKCQRLTGPVGSDHHRCAQPATADGYCTEHAVEVAQINDAAGTVFARMDRSEAAWRELGLQ